jgi:hypothetical protein
MALFPGHTGLSSYAVEHGRRDEANRGRAAKPTARLFTKKRRLSVKLEGAFPKIQQDEVLLLATLNLIGLEIVVGQ